MAPWRQQPSLGWERMWAWGRLAARCMVMCPDSRYIWKAELTGFACLMMVLGLQPNVWTSQVHCKFLGGRLWSHVSPATSPVFTPTPHREQGLCVEHILEHSLRQSHLCAETHRCHASMIPERLPFQLRTQPCTRTTPGITLNLYPLSETLQHITLFLYIQLYSNIP